MLRCLLSYSVLWIFLTPLVLLLGRKFPLEQEVRTRNLALHAGLSIVFGVLHNAVSNSVVWYMRLKPGEAFPFDRLFTTMIGYFDYGLLVYWIVLLIQQAFAYYRRVQERELKASQLETQLVETRLQALKMQLQPHFLFNTLHSISSLIHEDVKEADKMIARLGDFLRITLEKSGAQMVTLKSEIESLQSYFEIERVRFSEQLELILDIEPRTLDAQVPSFLWQPILENAIRHGIATSERQGRITFRARQNNGTLLLEVEDNGTGLPLNPQQSQEMKEGIGLANTRAILQHIYGSHHRFHVAPSPNGGAIATLEIPFAASSSSHATLERESYDRNRQGENIRH
jgi:two-component system LytT family sensor kinase